MHSAQLMAKHTAQQRVMQLAYAVGMKISSARHLRRKAKLDLLVQEVGGATALAALVETPKSHISALQAGNRGIGDELAAKMELATGKAAGWMDAPDDMPVALTDDALAFAVMYDRLGPHEQRRLHLLYQVARDGVNPSNIEAAPNSDASQPVDLMLGGDSGLGNNLDELPPAPPPPIPRRQRR